MDTLNVKSDWSVWWGSWSGHLLSEKHIPAYSFTGEQVDLGCCYEKEVCLFSCNQLFHGLNENASQHIY